MNALLIYLIVLRIVHFVAGTCWVGGAVIYHLLLEPTAKATAPGSRQFMQYFMVRRHYPVYMRFLHTRTFQGLNLQQAGRVIRSRFPMTRFPWIKKCATLETVSRLLLPTTGKLP